MAAYPSFLNVIIILQIMKKFFGIIGKLLEKKTVFFRNDGVIAAFFLIAIC